MNGAISSVTVEGHEDFRGQGVTVERDIECFDPGDLMSTPLFSLIERMLSVVGTSGMTGLPLPAGFSLSHFHRLGGTALTVRVGAFGHGT